MMPVSPRPPLPWGCVCAAWRACLDDRRSITLLASFASWSLCDRTLTTYNKPRPSGAQDTQDAPCTPCLVCGVCPAVRSAPASWAGGRVCAAIRS